MGNKQPTSACSCRGTSRRGTAAAAPGQHAAQPRRVVGAADERSLRAPGELDGEEGRAIATADDPVEMSLMPLRPPPSAPSTGSAREHAELERILGHFSDQFDEEELRRAGECETSRRRWGQREEAA